MVEKAQRKNRTLMYWIHCWTLVEDSPRVKRQAFTCCQYPKTKVGLVLCRGSLFVLAAALVIGAGVSSQYHPPVSHGNYSECSDDNSSSDVLTATVPSSSLTPSSITTVTAPSGSTVVLSSTRTVTSHSLQWSLGYSTTTVGSRSSTSSVLYYITPTPS